MYKRSKETVKRKNKLYRQRHPNYHKEWKKRNPEYFKDYYNKYKLNPEALFKFHARMFLNQQIKLGNMIRSLFCEKCKNTVKTEGHHNDYNKPLEVEWLCRVCHENLHHC